MTRQNTKANLLLLLFTSLLFVTILTYKSNAAVSVPIDSKAISKTKVGFVGFGQSRVGLELFDIVNQDLATTNLIDSVDTDKTESNQKSTTTLTDTDVESLPDFERYKDKTIDILLVSKIAEDSSGNVELKVRAWDIDDKKQLFGKAYSFSRSDYRKAANSIANEVFKIVTGEDSGHFNSQIVYVAEYGSEINRTKKIRLMDFDGQHQRALTDGSDLVLTPIFSKRKDEIFYLRYYKSKPQIFSLNTRNLKTQKIGGFNGTTFAASPHPNNSNLLLLSVIDDGNSDIYEMDIIRNIAKRLTKSPAIDTTPSYSNDGAKIVFSSDRDGSQQLYVMDNEGYSIRKISSGPGSYAKPVWSPDGKWIAFTKVKAGKFFVGIMSPSGKGEKILSSGYLVEGAKWSPSSRYLLYSKKRGSYGSNSIPKLFVVDIVTGFEFELVTPKNEGATDPDWAN